MATKQAPRPRIWTRTSESPIVCRGDSENRGPEADFGPPRTENQHFQNFGQLFAEAMFPTPFRVLEGQWEVSGPDPGQGIQEGGDQKGHFGGD